MSSKTSLYSGSVVCGSAPEGETVQLTCPSGATISHITFASFGNPIGSCGSFSRGTCDSPISLPLVQKVKFKFRLIFFPLECVWLGGKYFS